MSSTREAYQMEFIPIQLKELVTDCGISQNKLAQEVGFSRATINLAVNKGYLPHTMPDFQTRIETYLRGNLEAMKWLLQHGLKMQDIWQPLGKEMRMAYPAGHGKNRKVEPPIQLGDPTEYIFQTEVEMLTEQARKHFKLFRDPFPANGGIEKDTDIFMSDDHRYIEAAMLDAAKYSGLLAIVGQVGCGKSTIRKRVFEQIRREGGILTVFPQILDKAKIHSGTLCDAIILDISDQSPRIKPEQKARQVKELLKARSRNGDRCCLVIEEGHKLTVPAFITLKQLWELEDGYSKLLSIIIIGQTELGDKLDERHHPEMREFIRRCQIARINGLNGDLKNYLALKFKRIGASLENYFDDDAIAALSQRLTIKDELGKPVSHAYPLTVNLWAVRSMNLACEMGEGHVTADVVNAI